MNGSDRLAGQLPEAGAVPLLRSWLQGRQVVVGEAFQSFLIGSVWTATTVETMMLIEKIWIAPP